MVGGGYPAALARPTARRRINWYRNFIDTQLQRDVRDMTRISALEVLPRLLSASASQTSQLYNLSDLAFAFPTQPPTIGDYVELLERLFLIDRLPPWGVNRLSRLVKTPKLHIGDTGLGCALIGVNLSRWPGPPAVRAVPGNFRVSGVETPGVCQELPLEVLPLPGQRSGRSGHSHRTGSNSGRRSRGKGRRHGNPFRFRGLRKLKRATGERFAAGVVLYDGEITAGFGDGMLPCQFAPCGKAEGLARDLSPWE